MWGVSPTAALGPPAGLWLKTGKPGADGVAPEADDAVGEATRAPKKLVCRACGHWITTADAVVPVSGQADHVFANPAGFVFHVRCFKHAPGARPAGAPTTMHTWFPGYAWQIAHCGGCRAHLGWAFTGATDRFWGLLPERLLEVDDGEGSA